MSVLRWFFKKCDKRLNLWSWSWVYLRGCCGYNWGLGAFWWGFKKPRRRFFIILVAFLSISVTLLKIEVIYFWGFFDDHDQTFLIWCFFKNQGAFSWSRGLFLGRIALFYQFFPTFSIFTRLLSQDQGDLFLFHQAFIMIWHTF